MLREVAASSCFLRRRSQLDDFVFRRLADDVFRGERDHERKVETKNKIRKKKKKKKFDFAQNLHMANVRRYTHLSLKRYCKIKE